MLKVAMILCLLYQYCFAQSGIQIVMGLGTYSFQTTLLISSNSGSFRLPYPNQRTYTSFPKLLTALCGLQWQDKLSFEYKVNLGLNGMDIIVMSNASSNLNYLKFNQIIYDGNYYNLQRGYFKYYQDPMTWDFTQQQIIIINSSKASIVPYITCYQQDFQPQNQTGDNYTINGTDYNYTLPIVSVLNQTNYGYVVQVPGNSTYLISRLEMSLDYVSTSGFKIVAEDVFFFSVIYNFYGQQTTPDMVFQQLINNGNTFFYGIHMIHSILQERNQSTVMHLDAEPNNLTNQYAFTEEYARVDAFFFGIFAYKCRLNQSYFYTPTGSNQDGFCQVQCQPGTHQEDYKQHKRCYDCIWPCQECFGKGHNCTICQEPYNKTLTNEQLNFHQCFCPYGQWGVPGQCRLCYTSIPGCIQCRSGTQCLQCGPSLFLNENSLCQCNYGTMITTQDQILKCIGSKVKENCSQNLQLDETRWNCACPPGYSLINGICI